MCDYPTADTFELYSRMETVLRQVATLQYKTFKYLVLNIYWDSGVISNNSGLVFISRIPTCL